MSTACRPIAAFSLLLYGLLVVPGEAWHFVPGMGHHDGCESYAAAADEPAREHVGCGHHHHTLRKNAISQEGAPVAESGRHACGHCGLCDLLSTPRQLVEGASFSPEPHFVRGCDLRVVRLVVDRLWAYESRGPPGVR